MPVVPEHHEVQDTTVPILTRTRQHEVPSFQSDGRGARRIVHQDAYQAVRTAWASRKRSREVLYATVSGTQEVEYSGVRLKGESKAALRIRSGRIERALQPLAHAMKHHAHIAGRKRIVEENGAPVADSLARQTERKNREEQEEREDESLPGDIWSRRPHDAGPMD
jgi:hypothetical protein